MTRNSVLFTTVGQLSLFIFLFISFLLTPHFLLSTNEGGVSNYGLYAKTVVPYTLGLGLCGVLTIISAHYLPRKVRSYKTLKWSITILGVLYLIILFSTYPYKINATFNAIHIWAGFSLLLAEMIIGSWFGFRINPDRKNLGLLVLLYLGLSVGVITFFGLVHALFICQLIIAVAFGVLLIRTTKALVA